MATKTRIPLVEAQAIANRVLELLRPACHDIVIAGSIRRQKVEIGDVEIIAIPKRGDIVPPGELFSRETDLLELKLMELLRNQTFGKRLKINHTESYGPKLKLLVDQATGFSVDIFKSTPLCWWSTVLCRTGSGLHNAHLAGRALKLGYRWQMGGAGFLKLTAPYNVIPITSEQFAFEFLGVPYREPPERV